ncbi:hypothetical protein DFH08DRAFT_871491 [Mycena albidolilacea]|uniref:Uncharacterized protein n=1 Tax=Mycena albidolilacea TaxID=1033008 RepID=A0AAD7EQQ2_9AGAR|nr:hypothetical protein DFH08DRAFT_871491 [Mycena albidolilacea]
MRVCTPSPVRASCCLVHAPSVAPTSACRATPVTAWSTTPTPSANTPGLPCTHTVFVASIASATGFVLTSSRCAMGAKTHAKSGTMSAGGVTAGCDASSSARVCTGGEGVEGHEACGSGGASTWDQGGQGVWGWSHSGRGGRARGVAEQSYELWDRQLCHVGV